MSDFISNREIANILYEVAELLEIDDAELYRVRAYKNAALTVLNTGEPFAQKITQNADLNKLPTIGDELARAIEEIVRTGELKMLEDLEQSLPPDLVTLSQIPGIGAKRIKTIQKHLGLITSQRLRDAARRGELATLPGIGEKTQDTIRAYYA